MTREEAIEDIKYAIKPVVGGKSLDIAIESLTAISELSKRLKAVNRYEMDEKVLIGFNMAVAIFNECFGESCALKIEQSENVGMCQQNVGEKSEKTDGKYVTYEEYSQMNKFIGNEQTDGDLISRQAVITMLQKIENAVEDGDGFQFNEWIDYAKDIPSAEKTAEWIKQKSGDELFPEEIVCSKCYHSNSHLDFDEHNNPIGKVFLESKYCPNCGAKMEESEEE